MKTFQNAVQAREAADEQLRAQERSRKAEEKQAELVAVARRAIPFREAAASLQDLMDNDSDFRKFMEEKVLTRGEYRALASISCGTHTVYVDRWNRVEFAEVPTEWSLIIRWAENGKVKVWASQFRYGPNRDVVPERVCNHFQPLLEVLQDKEKVFDFLLKLFGTKGR